MENERRIRYFSMFTGVGGFELGIGEKGECIGFSEIDKYANQLLANKWPNIKNYGDATKINPRELPDFDMLCGGFPCQSFSIAGKRKGFEDTRGTMFFEIARILEIKRPKIILLENVKGLLNHDKGHTFSVILERLEELGYRTQWMVLNSKFFGVPQNRERVFIIGSLRGTSRPEILPFSGIHKENNGIIYAQKSDNEIARIYNPQGISPTLHGKTGGWQEPKISCAIDANYWRGNSPTHVEQGRTRTMIVRPILTPNRLEKRQNGRRFKEDGDESHTLTRADVHGVAIGNQVESLRIRRLTPLECERLQGFPDGWTAGFSDTQRYKMMGNAVTVNVIKAIIGRLYPQSP